MISLIAEELSRLLNLPKDVIEKTYKAYWLYIRTTILALPLKEELSDEDFEELRTSFTIPSIGKLNCTKQKYRNLKKRHGYSKNN